MYWTMSDELAGNKIDEVGEKDQNNLNVTDTERRLLVIRLHK